MNTVRAHRWARASALAYMLLLHALVFLSVARLSHRHAAAVLPTGAELARLCASIQVQGAALKVS